MGLGVTGASEGGFDLNATDYDFADPHVIESLIFPYGGRRNDDGTYSNVNKRSSMIVQDDLVKKYAGWSWSYSPWSVGTDHGYVRCMRE